MDLLECSQSIFFFTFLPISFDNLDKLLEPAGMCCCGVAVVSDLRNFFGEYNVILLETCRLNKMSSKLLQATVRLML